MAAQKDIAHPTKMPSAIFLDSGGVINDNAQRGPQWIRYLGEFLPTTVLGGDAQIWGQANAQIVRPFFSRWREYMAQAEDLAAKAQAKATQEQEQGQEGNARETTEDEQAKATNVCWIFERLRLLIWIKEMCRVAGPYVPGLESKILLSLSDDELFEIARSAHLYAIQRVKAAFPGAVETIRKLSANRYPSTGLGRGCKLYISSADSFEDLEHILKGLDVFECFDDIYGSDRVNCLKTSPQYFQRVFARVGVHPVTRDNFSGQVIARVAETGADVEEVEERDEVVVLDDNIEALKYARAVGARTVLVTSGEMVDLSLEEFWHVDYQIQSLSELPDLLESWKIHLAGQVV
ncbi:hypothetical protein BX616_010466 [Lobosporangium transversale]|uniref:HAD-like domain-containing protein n=1 Tax=Lobosporangium transversale TaxID=64571 RepID=A0A1Y2G9G4_9FUNG|nr:HAD-like domain-containing protein [Lobosporangium transversale]KAF9911852.1 hypothetical protein BX616_010466 [Lobosporangium transversale]ORZ04833.1 HAD-like domain-containing protein [Lobosporangium transversale]|eukprot:XP_021876770.1 HAD-like domain-containing protein [Lobosporangium transversale]